MLNNRLSEEEEEASIAVFASFHGVNTSTAAAVTSLRAELGMKKHSRLLQTGMGWFQCSSGCFSTWTKYQDPQAGGALGRLVPMGTVFVLHIELLSQPLTWFGPLLFMVLALPRPDDHGRLRGDTRKLSEI